MGPVFADMYWIPYELYIRVKKRTQKYGTWGPIFYTLLEVVLVSLQNSFHVRPVETQELHDDISALVILFMYLFIYFIKTPEFEEMGTTYMYNDTDNMINLMNT